MEVFKDSDLHYHFLSSYSCSWSSLLLLLFLLLLKKLCIIIRDELPLIPFMEFRIFFLPPWKKNHLSPASWLFFCLGKIGGIIRHYCRPATKYKISRSIRISRFHVWKSQVFVLFRNWKKKKASHFVACLQAHKAWAKNKFYDRLNWRPWLNPLHTATQRVR